MWQSSPEVLKYVHTLLEPHSYEFTLQGSPRMYLKLTLKTVHCSNAYHRRKKQTQRTFLELGDGWNKQWQNSGIKNEQQMHLLTEDDVCDIIL